mmetsp:Transcript_79541/g.221309  ORF Transcript_79541/g.221309 Transcript_79541/m.221309 type:complete len:220 (-) Transcript_79541:533-1192(-)
MEQLEHPLPLAGPRARAHHRVERDNGLGHCRSSHMSHDGRRPPPLVTFPTSGDRGVAADDVGAKACVRPAFLQLRRLLPALTVHTSCESSVAHDGIHAEAAPWEKTEEPYRALPGIAPLASRQHGAIADEAALETTPRCFLQDQGGEGPVATETTCRCRGVTENLVDGQAPCLDFPQQQSQGSLPPAFCFNAFGAAGADGAKQNLVDPQTGVQQLAQEP